MKGKLYKTLMRRSKLYGWEAVALTRRQKEDRRQEARKEGSEEVEKDKIGDRCTSEAQVRRVWRQMKTGDNDIV